MRSTTTGLVLLLATCWPLHLAAQETVPQPAHHTQEQAEERPAEGQPKRHLRSWEALPSYEAEVHAERPLREEEPIGEYNQPRWTAHRRFPTTGSTSGRPG